MMCKFLWLVAVMLSVVFVEAKRASLEDRETKKISRKLVNVDSSVAVKETEMSERVGFVENAVPGKKENLGLWHKVKSKVGGWFSWGGKKKESDAKAVAKEKAQDRKEKNYNQEKNAKEKKADHTKDVLDRSEGKLKSSKKEVRQKKQDVASVAAKAERAVTQSREAELDLQKAKDSGASAEEIQRLQAKAKKAFSKRMDSEKEQKASANRRLAAEGRVADKKDALGRAEKEEKKAKKALRDFSKEEIDPKLKK